MEHDRSKIEEVAQETMEKPLRLTIHGGSILTEVWMILKLQSSLKRPTRQMPRWNCTIEIILKLALSRLKNQ
ncbi:hypothetical protein ACMD2_01738 [Ananas comosus]|uniref:Uncharacterized protein n=1 Tax=Ananas comosus TaxID=4615 RepID=A0A199VJK1_ANACO|nr:hypothetical protein ACMD2_01738 [Ananas comosus]